MSPEPSAPISFSWKGEASPADRKRIQATVARGIRRGLSTAQHRSGHRPRPAASATAPLVTAPAAPPGPRPIPTGWLVGTAPSQVTARGDRVYTGQFVAVPLISSHSAPGLLRAVWNKAGDSVSAETDSLARARQLGEYLFGARGYAVLEPSAFPGRYVVLPLTSPVTAATFGGRTTERLTGFHVPEHVRITSFKHGYDLNRLGGFRLIELGESGLSGKIWDLNRPETGQDSLGEWVLRKIAATPNEEWLTQTEALDLARGLLGSGTPQEIAGRLVLMNHRIFALLSREDRVRALTVLIQFSASPVSGISEDEVNAAIVALILASAGSDSELEAIFARLRAAGVYQRLFGRMDKPVFTLLVTLGHGRPTPNLDPGYVKAVLTEMGRQALSLTGAVSALGTSWDWLRSQAGIVEGLLTLPELLVRAAEYLPKLLKLVQDLLNSENPTQDLIDRFTAVTGKVSKLTLQALAGLVFVESAGLAVGHRGGSSAGGLPPVAVAASIGNGAVIILAWELLSIFIASSKAKKTKDLKQLGDIFETFKDLRGAEQLVGTGEALARSQQLIAALAKKFGLGEDAALKALQWLPEHVADDLVRITAAVAEGVPLPNAVAAAMAAEQATVSKLERGLRAAAVVQRKVAAGGQDAAAMAAGLHRLLEVQEWSTSQLVKVLNDVTRYALPDFLKVAARLQPQQLVNLGTGALARVAASPTATALLTDAGYEVLIAAYRRHRSSVAELEEFAHRLAAKKTELDDPVAYRALLDRLAAAEPAAFDQIRPKPTGASRGRGPLARLRAAMATDAEAGHRLSKYENANYRQLLDWESLGDKVAGDLLDENYGGRSRPWLPDWWSANLKLRTQLKSDLHQLRAEVERQRKRPSTPQSPKIPPDQAWFKKVPGPDGQLEEIPLTDKEIAQLLGTVGVARTEIAGLEHKLYKGASPKAFGVGARSSRIQLTGHLTQYGANTHAEVRLAEQLDHDLLQLSPQQRAAARGKTVWMHIDEAVCGTCRTGIGKSDVDGALSMLSKLWPDILFEITAEDGSEVIRLLNGVRKP